MRAVEPPDGVKLMDGGSGRTADHDLRAEDFAGMRAAGQLAAATLDMITPHVRPASPRRSSTRSATSSSLAHGATPAPLNYRGFPKSICTSINHVVCHGIPGERKLTTATS